MSTISKEQKIESICISPTVDNYDDLNTTDFSQEEEKIYLNQLFEFFNTNIKNNPDFFETFVNENITQLQEEITQLQEHTHMDSDTNFEIVENFITKIKSNKIDKFVKSLETVLYKNELQYELQDELNALRMTQGKNQRISRSQYSQYRKYKLNSLMTALGKKKKHKKKFNKRRKTQKKL